MDVLQELLTDRSSRLKDAVKGFSAKLHEPFDSHILQEDTILFPTYAEASGGDGLVSPFVDEHRQILALRDDLFRACESADSDTLAKIGPAATVGSSCYRASPARWRDTVATAYLSRGARSHTFSICSGIKLS